MVATNKQGVKIELNGDFTPTQLEQLREDTTKVVEGQTTLTANTSNGMIYIEDENGKVLTALPRKISKEEREQMEKDMLISMYLDYANNFLSTHRMAEYYEIDEDELIEKINKGREMNNSKDENRQAIDRYLKKEEVNPGMPDIDLDEDVKFDEIRKNLSKMDTDSIYGNLGNTLLFDIEGVYGIIKKNEDSTYTIRYETVTSSLQTKMNEDLLSLVEDTKNLGAIPNLNKIQPKSADDMGVSYIKNITSMEDMKKVYTSILKTVIENKKPEKSKIESVKKSTMIKPTTK